VETGADRVQNPGMTHRWRLLGLIGVLAAGLGGCSSSGSAGAGDGPAAEPAPGDGGFIDPDADTFIPCTGDPRAERYAAGMQKTAPKGQLSVTLLSSDPGPPIKGTNVWTLLVSDSGRAPQTGATVKVKPFMPDHGHGSPAKPVISALPDAGQYKVTPLYLFMAGLWEITLDVTTASGVQDAVVFRFCIEQ
jgi:hypothetical protein